MNKCKPLLQQHAHAYFIDDVFPLAENMVPLALKAYQQKQFVDTAYFEPFYLKEFQTTTTRKKCFEFQCKSLPYSINSCFSSGISTLLNPTC